MECFLPNYVKSSEGNYWTESANPRETDRVAMIVPTSSTHRPDAVMECVESIRRPIHGLYLAWNLQTVYFDSVILMHVKEKMSGHIWQISSPDLVRHSSQDNVWRVLTLIN